jgi:hypothetical protein
LPGAIQDQELMLEQKRLSNDGTGTARSEQASQGSDEMDEKDDQIVAGREIPTNYGRNNNSPATRTPGRSFTGACFRSASTILRSSWDSGVSITYLFSQMGNIL